MLESPFSDNGFILYEDNHLFVLNKPCGLLTQPSGTDQDSLEAWGKQWIKEKYHKSGNVFLEAVHRLDKPASGIVVFARTSKALSRLNTAMRNKSTLKNYLALVEGYPGAQEGLLEHNLVHDEHMARVGGADERGAKLARLRYRVVRQSADATLLEIVLETGRYHQIRVQLAALGCPIAGDFKYGSRKRHHCEGCIALHHCRLQIPHPISGLPIIFEAPCNFSG